MANKLRSSNARVSFFAFLDMITAVTGVLLLITLLMTLYMNDAPATPAAQERDAARDRVDQARSQLAAKLAELRDRQAEAAALTNRLFVVPESDPSGKETILVVVSAANGVFFRPGQGGGEQFASAAEFGRILEKFDAGRQRLVFYIRPSGVIRFRSCQELATKRSFSVAYDAAKEGVQYSLASP
jgi:hypothetical protein